MSKLEINKKVLCLEDVSKNKAFLLEFEQDQNNIRKLIYKHIIDYNKLKDKLILSKMTVKQLKNLIKMCEEVIQDKLNEVKNDMEN